MKLRTVLAVLLLEIGSSLAAPTLDKTPYEFALKLGDTQHRQEKKDENGIITGEYGFATADGYYYVLSFATDENGKFQVTGRKKIGPRKPIPSVPPYVPPKRATPRPFNKIQLDFNTFPKPAEPPTGPKNSRNVDNTTPIVTSTTPIATVAPIQQTTPQSLPPTAPPTTTVPFVRLVTSPTESPKTVSKSECTNGLIVYEFAYEALWHAFAEKGYDDFSKTGQFHFDGEDGIRRSVVYCADGDGFKPVVRTEIIGKDQFSHNAPATRNLHDI